MDNDTMIKVTNRSVGSVGYTLPELHLKRRFTPRETKEITFAELNALYNSDGGKIMVKEHLAIKSKEALDALGVNVEPEYFYGEDEVKKIMVTGSLAEFLDMLDFGPDGVLEIVKSLAVSLPLNDVTKRNAIFEKLGFNVTKAIEIQNTKYDDGSEDTTSKVIEKVRRVSSETSTDSAPKRRIIKKEEN